MAGDGASGSGGVDDDAVALVGGLKEPWFGDLSGLWWV